MLLLKGSVIENWRGLRFALETMKIALHLRVAVLILVLSFRPCCFPQASRAKPAESARRFVQAVYALYGPTGNPANLFEDNAGEVLPSLIALARSDMKAAKPDVGALDNDPVCNCQDTDVGFPNLKITVQPVDGNRATATVTFSGDSHEPNKIVLTLLKEKGRWLIFNIEDLSGPGPHTDLRAMLKADAQKLSSKQE